MFKKGDKVTYNTEYEKEHGIVKAISDNKHVFVVYNCNEEWDNYEDYTAKKTPIVNLCLGWV